MESIRKQASKLREQVAKQQQAVLRQLGHLGHEAFMDDEAELQCHQQLQNLYNSTRDAKHFQRNILRGIEAFVSISSKQMEMVRKLAQDCCKYGDENQSSESTCSPLVRASLLFGTSHYLMEEEKETLLGIFVNQVCEPLRAQIRGAPLEDARHLAHRYEKLRQEVESQEAEVLRRRLKSRDSSISVESSTRLQLAEARLTELKSITMALGKEATAALSSVEVQQQQLTFQKLLTMMEAERTYHQKALEILEKLHAEITLEKQPKEFSLPSEIMQREVYHQYVRENIDSNGSGGHGPIIQNKKFFIAKAVHSFDAQADGELSLSVDDYVVVRQVAPTGWSEGECNGISGWFPSAYVQRQEKAPASKVMEATSEPCSQG
ncbi:SH3 domain-containing protein 1-like isoform X2 [Juglans microcarpa x Juglans regia]|uniref:SH3 domain-containing protein 1-like isoform X2 n=1 Tax=Juglans microcarpa x Juglans regia TaxID=2249226 RepID=UPI001B7F04C0|nr:SH3 domain-containing protein 1-like isoform X2 [Juglans microcarpa x Juglans regia]